MTNIFPEGTEFGFGGVCGVYYPKPKNVYDNPDGFMEYPYAERITYINDGEIKALPISENGKYYLTNVKMNYLSPDINWGHTGVQNYTGPVYHITSNSSFILYNKNETRYSSSDGQPFYKDIDARYVSGIISTSKYNTKWYIDISYNADLHLYYMGPYVGFKGKAIGDWSYPGFDKCRNLVPQSYIDIFNGLYDFTAAGETPDSNQGVLKLNPRAFKILTPEELAIATNKGWQLIQ